jgi:hypothetical protein
VTKQSGAELETRESEMILEPTGLYANDHVTAGCRSHAAQIAPSCYGLVHQQCIYKARVAQPMTLQTFEQARCKLTRFGDSFDISLTSKLPHPVTRTKEGKIAKRRPQYDKRPKTYYQAQYAFRNFSQLPAQELQQALQSREVRQNEIVHHELVRLGREAA